eukprot:3672228-Rhodomonas_salina.2
MEAQRRQEETRWMCLGRPPAPAWPVLAAECLRHNDLVGSASLSTILFSSGSPERCRDAGPLVRVGREVDLKTQIARVTR